MRTFIAYARGKAVEKAARVSTPTKPARAELRGHTIGAQLEVFDAGADIDALQIQLTGGNSLNRPLLHLGAWARSIEGGKWVPLDETARAILNALGRRV